MDIITITKDNFQAEVIEAKGTVLIDFWASWCGPCRMLSPIVDQVAEEHPDIKVSKINVDEEPELASQFDVKDGQKVNESVGLIPKEKVEELIP